jgi:hypothetical protein
MYQYVNNDGFVNFQVLTVPTFPKTVQCYMPKNDDGIVENIFNIS